MDRAENQENDAIELGAAVRFLQCGAEITVQGTSEGLSRLAAVLKTASERSGQTEARYTDPEAQSPGVVRIETVEALTTSAPTGNRWVVPIASVAGAIWVIILPVIGLVALLWLLVQLIK